MNTLAITFLGVVPSTLPSAIVGSSFRQQLTASDGTGPYTFSETGSLDGLTLSASGLLSGTPAAAGTFNFVVTVTDSVGDTGAFSYTLTVNPQSMPLIPGQINNGIIYFSAQIDTWTFTAQAAEQVQFNLLNESNPEIQFDLTGPNGYVAFRDANSSSGLINLPSSGNYELTVQSSNGQLGAYAFEVLATTQTALSLNTPYEGILNGTGQAQLFTVTVPQAGTALLVNLTDNSSADQN